MWINARYERITSYPSSGGNPEKRMTSAIYIWVRGCHRLKHYCDLEINNLLRFASLDPKSSLDIVGKTHWTKSNALVELWNAELRCLAKEWFICLTPKLWDDCGHLFQIPCFSMWEPLCHGNWHKLPIQTTIFLENMLKNASKHWPCTPSILSDVVWRPLHEYFLWTRYVIPMGFQEWTHSVIKEQQKKHGEMFELVSWANVHRMPIHM